MEEGRREVITACFTEDLVPQRRREMEDRGTSSKLGPWMPRRGEIVPPCMQWADQASQPAGPFVPVASADSMVAANTALRDPDGQWTLCALSH